MLLTWILIAIFNRDSVKSSQLLVLLLVFWILQITLGIIFVDKAADFIWLPSLSTYIVVFAHETSMLLLFKLLVVSLIFHLLRVCFSFGFNFSCKAITVAWLSLFICCFVISGISFRFWGFFMSALFLVKLIGIIGLQLIDPACKSVLDSVLLINIGCLIVFLVQSFVHFRKSYVAFDFVNRRDNFTISSLKLALSRPNSIAFEIFAAIITLLRINFLSWSCDLNLAWHYSCRHRFNPHGFIKFVFF